MKLTHHDRIEAASPEEERELRAVVALLRGLPDPEPPEGLAARVVAEARRRESGPRVLRVAFRRLEPLVATALAAGVGALVLTTAVQSGLLSSGAPTAPTGLQPSAARRVADAGSASATVARPRISPVYVAMPATDLHAAPLRGMPSATPLTAGLFDPHPSVGNPMDRRLDHELNSLLLDPLAFYERMQQMGQPDRFVARLVDRATRRGDAAQIALRLRSRSPDHPNTTMLVDRLLRASVVDRTRR